MQIENGWGDGGWKARITDEGQIYVITESHTEARHKAEEGKVFMIASGFAASPASADDFTNVLYVKNTSTTKDIHIGYLRTCNEVSGKWRILDAPTALGTSALTASNSNRSNATPLVATVQAFSTAGTTFTDGTAIGQWIQGAGHSIQPFDGSYILGPNDSFGLEFAPFNGTAGEMCVTLQCWQITD